MKKLLFISLLILAACMEEPEVKKHSENSNARIMSECQSGYSWLIGENSLTTVTAHVYWIRQLRHFTYDPTPWTSSGLATRYITVKFENVGAATFKISLKSGAVWNTLTPGQSITRSLPIPYCDASGNQLTNVDIQRLSCGLLGLRTSMIAAGSPHTVYGGSNGPGDFADIWTGCNL